MTQAQRSPVHQMVFVARALPHAVPIAIPAAKARHITDTFRRIMAAITAWLLAPALQPGRNGHGRTGQCRHRSDRTLRPGLLGVKVKAPMVWAAWTGATALLLFATSTPIANDFAPLLLVLMVGEVTSLTGVPSG